MLNSFLRGASNEKCAECSATLDLLELDLMNGRASFYKCGAAASYIYRKGRLFKLRAESMPIGILPDVDLKKNDFELNDMEQDILEYVIKSLSVNHVIAPKIKAIYTLLTGDDSGTEE